MIARQSTLVLLNNLVGASLGLVAIFLIARYFGDSGDAALGQRAAALSFVTLAGIAVRLGLPTTHVRRLAQGGDVAAANGAFLALKLSLAAVFAALALGFAAIWFGVLHRDVTDVTPTALWLAFWIVLVQAVRDVPVTAFQGLRRIVRREAVLLANTVVTVVLGAWVCVAYAASHGRWTPWPAASDLAASVLQANAPMSLEQGVDLLLWAFFIGELVALVLAFVLFLQARIPIGRPAPGLIRNYLKSTVPIMLVSVGEAVTKWLAYPLLVLWATAADTGLFAGPAKYTEAFAIFPLSIVVVLLPAVSRLHAAGNDSAVRKLTTTVTRWVSLLLWPACALAIAWREPIMHILLSDAFLPAAPVLALLAVQGLAAALLIPTQAMAIGTGRTGMAARIVGITIVIDLVLDAILIPGDIGLWRGAGLAATGAAIAALTSTLVGLALYAWPRSAWPGMDLLGAGLHKHALAATGIGVAAALLPPPTRLLGLAGMALLGLAVYGAILLAMRELRREDRRAFLALMRRSDATSPEAMP